MNRIRGVRQGVAGNTYLGRTGGRGMGAVTALPFPNSATATATAGGFSPQSSTGSGAASFNATGAWSSVAAYAPGDVATFNGAAWCNYAAVAAPGPNTSPDLDPTHWLSQGNINTVSAGFTLAAGQLQFLAPALWTPTDASGASLVLTSLSANYTRIGNMVFAYATVTYPATVDASAARIGGLPVAVPNIGYAQVPFYIRNTGGAFGTFGLAASGTSTFVILNDVSGAAVTNAQLSSLIVCWMAIYPAT